MLHKFLAQPSLLYTSVLLAERVLRVFNFASDIDARKSVTGYLMFLNGGPVSWKASCQGGVTLSSSEAEFVAARPVSIAESQPALKVSFNRPRPRSQPARAAGRVVARLVYFFSRQ